MWWYFVPFQNQKHAIPGGLACLDPEYGGLLGIQKYILRVITTSDRALFSFVALPTSLRLYHRQSTEGKVDV